MTNDQKQKLERQLWNIANELRGKMDADEFRDYILGFVFTSTFLQNSTSTPTNCLKEKQ